MDSPVQPESPVEGKDMTLSLSLRDFGDGTYGFRHEKPDDVMGPKECMMAITFFLLECAKKTAEVQKIPEHAAFGVVMEALFYSYHTAQKLTDRGHDA